MDNENHKKTWEVFTKFVLWGSIVVAFNSYINGFISFYNLLS